MRDKEKREKITTGTEETNVSGPFHRFKGLNEEISFSYVSGRQMNWNLLDGALTLASASSHGPKYVFTSCIDYYVEPTARQTDRPADNGRAPHR